MQLPLGLLTAAQGHPMLVELKNGETLNGHLVTCDTWMNLTLKEVVQTSPVCSTLSNAPLEDPLTVDATNARMRHLCRAGAGQRQLAYEPILTSFQEGDKFFRLAEVYVKGNNVSPYRPPLGRITITNQQTDQVPPRPRRDNRPCEGSATGSAEQRLQRWTQQPARRRRPRSRRTRWGPWRPWRTWKGTVKCYDKAIGYGV